jgi:Ca2+-transporting ATPase
MELILFLALTYLFTFLFGILIEKIRIPWIFAALFLGFGLAVYNSFSVVTSSSTFEFLAELGMFFLLFIIGFEIDLKEMLKKEKFFVKATFFIILLEGFFGTLVVHFVFGYDWLISALVVISFATVGEAVLIPILDEFGLVNKSLGQTIIGIGVLDDIIEIVVIVMASMLVGISMEKGVSFSSIGITLLALFTLFILAFGLTKLGKEGRKLRVHEIEALFLFVMFIFFLFIWIGGYAKAEPIGALLAGIASKNFIPKRRLKFIESEVKTLGYGLFAPLFFVWVGLDVSMNYLISYPLLVLLVIIVSNSSKILGSYVIGKKRLGKKPSFLLGIGLCVRFSTSLVIIKILFENALIGTDLYSVLIASTAVTPIVPILFSWLLVKWKIAES